MIHLSVHYVPGTPVHYVPGLYTRVGPYAVQDRVPRRELDLGNATDIHKVVSLRVTMA